MSSFDHARRSLAGLSVGDALGQAFFIGRESPPEVLVRERSLPPAPWRFSDDTVMAQAIVDVLERHGHINQDALAVEFSRRFRADPERGYGPVAYWLLYQLGEGRPWREVSHEVFGGKGSLGNGGAMRSAPLGAWFADDLKRVVAEAKAAAEVTHAHPDGQAGSIAVALAAALLVRAASSNQQIAGEALLHAVVDRLEPTETRAGLERALALLPSTVEKAVADLGDGKLVRSSDTVPFALWCVANSPFDYEGAIWRALSGLTNPDSDRDTTLAIVGGVVGSVAAVPPTWIAAREPLG